MDMNYGDGFKKADTILAPGPGEYFAYLYQCRVLLIDPDGDQLLWVYRTIPHVVQRYPVSCLIE